MLQNGSKTKQINNKQLVAEIFGNAVFLRLFCYSLNVESYILRTLLYFQLVKFFLVDVVEFSISLF